MKERNNGLGNKSIKPADECAHARSFAQPKQQTLVSAQTPLTYMRVSSSSHFRICHAGSSAKRNSFSAALTLSTPPPPLCYTHSKVRLFILCSSQRFLFSSPHFPQLPFQLLKSPAAHFHSLPLSHSLIYPSLSAVEAGPIYNTGGCS